MGEPLSSERSRQQAGGRDRTDVDAPRDANRGGEGRNFNGRHQKIGGTACAVGKNPGVGRGSEDGEVSSGFGVFWGVVLALPACAPHEAKRATSPE